MNVQEKRIMKRWLWPLLLFVSMFFAGGCSSDFNPLDYVEVKLPPLSKEQQEFCYTGSWYTWEKFKNEKGVVVKFESYDGSISFGIKLLSRPERLPEKYPLNMPEEYKVEGLEMVFSGETRDHPLIDLDGLPLVLTDLWVKKNSGVIK